MNYRWTMAALALCACSGEPIDTGEEATLGTASDALREEYIWNKGQAAQDMGLTSGRVCMLARVSGKLTSTSDFVRIISSGGHWWLTGQGTATGGTIGAYAVCVPGTLRGSEIFASATQGNQADVGLGSGGPCFFTHIGGRFAGGGESVLIDGNWSLHVRSNTPQGVEARARCISNKSLLVLRDGSTVRSWSQGQPPTPLYLDTADAKNPLVACFLLHMTGKFMGFDERVDAYYNPETNFHYLNGHVGTLGGSIAAKAGCISSQ